MESKGRFDANIVDSINLTGYKSVYRFNDDDIHFDQNDSVYIQMKMKILSSAISTVVNNSLKSMLMAMIIPYRLCFRD